MQSFINHGYKVVEFDELADIYVINTCTVTNMADKKSRQMFHRVKEKNPDAILVVVGCYAQVAKDELEKMKQIDLILGTNEKRDIVQYVEAYMQDEESILSVSDVLHEKEFADFGAVTYTEKTRAVIKVQDGCDRFCSYCLIPYARGRVRSRRPESILDEVSKNAENGIEEVVITGIHIASYGKDFREDAIEEINEKLNEQKDEYRLIDLLEDMNKIEKIKRIRLGSLEPKLITEEFAKRLSKLDKICNHFHLSLQSGCTETLKRMNRRYTAEEFKEVTQILRKYYPNVSLTTDVIVGFPGETDAEFNETYEFLKDIKFYKMHIFKYSPRKGTKAAVMPNQIDGNVKEERSKKLIELSDEFENTYNKEYVGKEVEVLFEENHQENDEQYIKGHTTNYIVVKVKNNDDMIKENSIQSVKIIGTDKTELIGEKVIHKIDLDD